MNQRFRRISRLRFATSVRETSKSIVLSFGKHKGKQIKQVEDGYVEWMQATLARTSWWGKVAVQVLEQRSKQKAATKSSKRALLNELKSCASLEKGKQIHARAVENGDVSCLYVSTALVTMFSKCGSMIHARSVFDEIKQPDVVSWNALILGYAENGVGGTALELFARMKSQCCAPDGFTFVAALKACACLAVERGRGGECLEMGKQIHSEIGCHLDNYVQSALIDMYAKCGSMAEAHQVFECIRSPDVVSWTALILGYAEKGEGSTALDLFASMTSRGCAPNSITFIAALKACTSLAAKQEGSRRAECLERGREIHSEIGHEQLNVYVENTLIDMYGKCGSMAEARRVFDSMRHPDLVSWTVLILGYAENGEGLTALHLFARMRSQGCAPNALAYVAALKSCSLLGDLTSGRRIHAEIDDRTGVVDAMLVTSLVDFYAKCGCLVEAQEIFDKHTRRRDLTTWNALLAGYCRLGADAAAFELFELMQDACIRPNGVTFLCILTCCSHAGLVEKANCIFEAMSTTYGITPTVEHYTCMVDILSRSNRLIDAVQLLSSMPCTPNSVTWMTLLAACRKWKNVEIGRLAFTSLVGLDDTIAAAYVLMAHIYASRSMWEEQEMVLVMRRKFKAWKEPGRSCWTNEAGQVHVFLVGDSA